MSRSDQIIPPRLTARERYIARVTASVVADVAKLYPSPEYSDADRAILVQDLVAEDVADNDRQAAEEREAFGYPEDTPSLQSCDQWGTGEGRYHGVIG